jgi:predicted flavoprotein YhiN
MTLTRTHTTNRDHQGPHKHLARPTQMPLLTQRGPLLVTHQGLSGPAVLRLRWVLR